jgi:hypothetical protein
MARDEGFVRVPQRCTQTSLASALAGVEGRESELLAAATARVEVWSWCKQHMLAYRPEPFCAERFGERTPAEHRGEPPGPAIRIGRDGDGRVAVVDIGDMQTLETDRGLRYEAWCTDDEAVIIDQTGAAFGVQRRVIEAGKVLAFARLTRNRISYASEAFRYSVESYDYDADGRLDGIRSSGFGALPGYMQVVHGPGSRQRIVPAPAWATEPTELTDHEVDLLEQRLRSAIADRAIELMAAARIEDEILYVNLYGDLPRLGIYYATAQERLLAQRRRRYLPFDFYLWDMLPGVNTELPEWGVADLLEDADLLNRELTKRRQQTRLGRLTCDAALLLNERRWPVEVPMARDAITIAIPGVSTRKGSLLAMRASLPVDRWDALEAQESALAAEHAARTVMPEIPRRSARKKLAGLLREADGDERHIGANTGRQAWQAFRKFRTIGIKGVAEEHDVALFEVSQDRDPRGDVLVTFTRQLTLQDAEEAYQGMETIAIAMHYSVGASESAPPAETIWSEGLEPDEWAERVEATPAFAILIAGNRLPTLLETTQSPI